ncbi:MAG: hypothetical protein UX85_C0001G0007 [Candidatus Beckwithbacteria bacterium GW2011_GWB1_47_15]|uniref:Uncharacterized protein n=1 Tax=Candidatus Beckwithbacteria bacterium GW2011_GWB1_47_15 TaxID=1618371 RepID=A0A0G1U669_9BACT|nr:MAG: hypothetical protein UY43_C0001G1123 [Candidatus Beckwithbacteria bacterium GW2011_GWC1_49_16]AQS30641.1 hypothetical protein [uncultured bacterium]KKU35829.1 MAG: hypothetical protein UX50_C0001G0006 [Candidatus Beckwithbacteria bacterium GW2011_GWA1_46_30]KKU61793.1 MAG: hypothetical protein UX85_C0001G0007 [Candidatus Beckwithbacteria bacterium GW2011_GWB1_47_15]KKU72653.1 MAG: hypothetical protein UX97_C0001G0523 [Candidatus Beckwithbacteria bacterium GW2011_GWA2_47_25]KKW04178.1 M
MLPRVHRLPGYRVRQLLSAPVVKREPGLTVKAAANHLDRPRFGVVITKKAARGAVQRNNMKRQTMIAIEKQIGAYEPGKDYLFLVYEAPHFKAD